MKIQVSWYDDERTVLLQTFQQGWAWPDFIDLSKRQIKMMDEVNHRVDMIGDARGVNLPKGVLQYLNEVVSNSALSNHPNAGIYVIIGASNTAQTFLRIFQNVFQTQGQRVFTAKTVEEAQRIIQTQRTIPAKGDN